MGAPSGSAVVSKPASAPATEPRRRVGLGVSIFGAWAALNAVGAVSVAVRSAQSGRTAASLVAGALGVLYLLGVFLIAARSRFARIWWILLLGAVTSFALGRLAAVIDPALKLRSILVAMVPAAWLIFWIVAPSVRPRTPSEVSHERSAG